MIQVPKGRPSSQANSEETDRNFVMSSDAYANHEANLAKCSRNKSNRCSRTFQHLRFDHESASRVGTRAESGKAIAHIQGIGSRWRNSLVFHSVCDNFKEILQHSRSHSR